MRPICSHLYFILLVTQEDMQKNSYQSETHSGRTLIGGQREREEQIAKISGH